MPLLGSRGAASASGFGFQQGGLGPFDPNFENVSLLLSGDGTNGAQNNTFLDSSTNNFTITRNGNTTQGSFSPYGSNWGNFFNGTGDYLATPSSANLAIGTSDFCIECFFNLSSTSEQTFLSQWGGGANNWILQYRTGPNEIRLFYNSSNEIVGSFTLVLNQWNHIVVCRSGSTMSLYANGVRLATKTDSTNIGNTRGIDIGRNGDNIQYVNGYISNVRLVVGSSVYTPSSSTLTVPTVALTAISGTQLLTCQANRLIDSSTNNFTITKNGDVSVQRFSPFNPTAPYYTSVIGGSGFFDGSGDYLTSVTNAAFNFGSGAFTIEAFYYTSSAGNQVIISGWNGSGGGNDSTSAFEIIYSGGILYCQVASGTTATALTTTTWPLNQWNHVVLVANGSTMSAYLNGTRFATTSFSSAVNDAAYAPQIGTRSPSTSFPFAGYIASARIVKGTAVYDPTSSTLTVPTAPLTAITNTSLLCSMTNAGIPDLAMQNNLETVGNAQVSTSVKKYGTGSLAFDGSGDVLSTIFKPQFNFSGDFTIECWLYMNSLASTGTVWSQNSGSTFFILHTSVGGSNSLDLYIDTLGGAPAIQSSSLSTGVWYHVALTKSGSAFKLFLNGTQTGSTFTNSGNPTPSSNPSFFIGNNNASNGAPLNGYIDDLRVTTGLARYTTTFTPPASALPKK